MPYEKVCKAFDNLDKFGYTTRAGIREVSERHLADCLKMTGFRFPNQTGRFIKLFGDNPIDLKYTTRDSLVKDVKGIGMKLASMFLRNTRGDQVAVIDVHIINFLKERGEYQGSYLKDEATLIKIANDNDISIHDLDFIIWEDRRVGNK